MRAKVYFPAICILLIICCSKDDFNVHDPDVDQFVRIVRDGNYFEEIGFELPDFKMKDIDRLLHYSHDTSEIEEFPTNPLSSKYTTPKVLNECLLWTIDGIRFSNKYPSLEPCLIDKSEFVEDFGYSRLTGEELIEVADLYLNWFEEYSTNPSDSLKTKNILENSTYSW